MRSINLANPGKLNDIKTDAAVYLVPYDLKIAFWMGLVFILSLSFLFLEHIFSIELDLVVYFSALVLVTSFITFFYYRIFDNLRKQKLGLETNLEALQEFLNNEYDIFIIFDENYSVIQGTADLLKDIVFEKEKNILNIENICSTLNLKKDASNALMQAAKKGQNFSTYAEILYNLKPFKAHITLKYLSPTNLLNGVQYVALCARRMMDNKEVDDFIDNFNFGYYELDEYGYITKCNTFFARVLGYSAEDIATNFININELIANINAFNNDNSQSAFTLRQNWQGFVTINTPHHEHVYGIIMQRSYYSEFGNISKITGYFIKLLDKTLLIKAKGIDEGWIDYSWKCFFADSPYPVLIVDTSGIIQKVNESTYSLIEQDVIGKQFFSIFNEESELIIKQEIENSISNPKSLAKPILNLRLLNDKKVDTYLGKVKDLQGNLYGFNVRLTDITQQKQIEESLSHSQRMQTVGYLAGSIAHDFNNILTAILGFSDLLLLKHTPSDHSFPNIMQIRQSAIRASNLVKRLLAFSRKQTLKPHFMNLNEFFGDFYVLIERLVGDNISVKQVVPADLWYVKVDHVQFEQVILNLIINAHHAMGESGTITLKSYNLSLEQPSYLLSHYLLPKGENPAPSGDYVVIEVEDTGSGIPADIIDCIFDPFFTTKHEVSGTGLGLSTVYGIIMQSGGYIYLKTQVGIGTTFLILLPKYIPSQNEIFNKSSVKEEVQQDYTGKGQIILVEDEESVRSFSKQVLIAKGYQILDFASPLKALEALKDSSLEIKLVISDVVMPEMNGPLFIDELLKITPKFKVIFISGYGEEAFTEAYGNIRDFNFLPKPFTLKNLLEKVKEVINE